MSQGKKTYEFYEALAKLQIKDKKAYASKVKGAMKQQGKAK